MMRSLELGLFLSMFNIFILLIYSCAFWFTLYTIYIYVYIYIFTLYIIYIYLFKFLAAIEFLMLLFFSNNIFDVVNLTARNNRSIHVNEEVTFIRHLNR